MSLSFGHVLNELEGILDRHDMEKAATAAQLDSPAKPGKDGNVLDGNRKATDGAGKKLSTPGGQAGSGDPADVTDHTNPQVEQTGKQTTQYNMPYDNNAKDKKQHKSWNSNEGDVAQKAAEKANNILAWLNQMVHDSSNEKKAGEDTAEAILRKIVQEELHKRAMPEGDKRDYEDDYEEGMDEDEESDEDEDEDYEEGEEKMSSAEWKEYKLGKEAGARAAVEFLSKLAAGQQGALAQQAGSSAYSLQKQAALQDYMLSKQAGAQLAEATIQQLLASQQHEKSAYDHPMNAPSPDEAYNQMLKWANDAGIDPDSLHGLLTELYKDQQVGGTPSPFVDRDHIKSSADVGPVYPVLEGLLREGTISKAEKDAILDYLGSAESLDENVLLDATKHLSNKQAVLERMMAGDLQENQRNAHRAPSPEPAMPMTQASPGAMEAEETGSVSMSDIPGSLEEHLKEGGSKNAAHTMLVEAALRQALKNVNPDQYGSI